MIESSATDAVLSARLLHQSGNFAAARMAYDAILGTDPNNAEVLHLAGVLACQTGRLARSVTLFNRALEICRHSASLYSSLGSALRALRRPDEALASATVAVAINSAYGDAHFLRALVLHDLDRHAEALAAYDRVIV